MTADAGTRRLILRLAVCLLVALTFAAILDAEGYAFVKKWGSPGIGNGQFSAPTGIAVDAAGNVYVADSDNCRIQKFTSDGDYITQWGSYGWGDGQFIAPRHVAVGPSGVYVVAGYQNRVQRFTPDGGFLGKWGSRGPGDGKFMGAHGIAVDAGGDVYVCDCWDQTQRIQKFSPSGQFKGKWGSPGSLAGEFQCPVDVAAHPSGRLYVVDYGNYRIQKFNLFGRFLTEWGHSGSGDGEFDLARAVAVDAWGNVYVVDGGNNRRFQKFSSNGHFITKWGSAGTGDGECRGASDIAVDAAGNVYVADTGNDRIQKFAPVVYQPDMRARLSRDDAWSFNNVYGPARKQTLTTAVRAGNERLFYLSVQNDSPTVQTCRVYGTAVSAPWSIRYSARVNGEFVVITDAITGGGGWEVGPLGPGKQQVFHAEIGTPASAPGGTSRFAVVRAVSEDGSTADAVKLVLRVRRIRNPDARIKLPHERRWTGNNVYDEYGKQQIRRRSVAPERNAIYHLSFQNDGNARDSFKITGPKSNAQWRIRYFAALSGGTNVTPEVTGGGWTTPSLKPGEAQEMLVSVTPKATAFEGDRKVVRVVAAATEELTEQDAVKAITTVESTSAAVCQVTSLSAVPTRAGAQLTFALSSDARVTATVLNVAGRPIKTIVADRPLGAGVQTLLWNRTNSAGLAVPHGTYLVRVTARDPGGREASALATVALK